ncbi:MAG: hypothetical protein EWV41_16805 [Microcystis wesenbergii Mw_MB_S_20031200_S109]|uniref:Uncharacterized protein n=1 Tax=Microcystis wesenbergii Mw_MB_S_20031200_S109D TaxID=2486241 RepID=A0A552M521_9CHRO|nr:MAG: hypothetical protein EWV41_16805 [Microcystis wesenbergii Mw_MB_S_20031200_S109]TRV27573.1 MAG: hypothetical protein EWV88_04570 [Microcystis wesenbergii Mw_MB_S_20031200_S109D]
MTISGRTASIISRFPHFYPPEDPKSFLPQFLDVFGEILDEVEQDLIRVLKSHFINTADNFDSLGFTATQKGDLDKIFALMLAELGGTSQLTTVNPEFQPRDFTQISLLVKELVDSENPLSSYIFTKIKLFENTENLINKYHVNNSYFSKYFQFHLSLILKFIIGEDAFTSYLRDKLSAETKEKLFNYDGSTSVKPNLNLALIKGFNEILREERNLYKYLQQRNLQINLLQHINQGVEPVKIVLARGLYRRLSIKIQRIFSRTNPPFYPQDITPEIEIDLKNQLKALFKNITFVQQLSAAIDKAEVAEIDKDKVVVLSTEAINTLLAISKISLSSLLLIPENTTNLEIAKLSPEAEYLLSQVIVGDDLIRLNRMLLESVYPEEIPSSKTPTAIEVAEQLAQAFNQQILTDDKFYENNKQSFTFKSLSPEVQSLIQSASTGAESQSKLLNRLLLETAYPTYLEKSITIYRKRLERLVDVLKSGASTQEGIVKIVAANLGMSTDDNEEIKPWESYLFDIPITLESSLSKLTVPEELQKVFREKGLILAFGTTIVPEKSQHCWLLTDASQGQVYRILKKNGTLKVYRQLIRVIEFFPELVFHKYTIHPHIDKFYVQNPNAVPAIPAIQIKILDNRKNPQGSLSPLTNISLINLTNHQSIKYEASLNINAVLLLLPDGSAMVNGGTIPNPPLAGTMPSLPLGQSEWSIEADIGNPQVTFDSTLFDFSLFESNETASITTKEQANSYLLEVTLSFYQITPGGFTVKIPWQIPGYSDRFDESLDHPRHQIQSLIEKVKASGICAKIAYEQQFKEDHQIEEKLLFQGKGKFSEDHNITDEFDGRSQQSLRSEQEMSDTFLTSAVFDYTYFDTIVFT